MERLIKIGNIVPKKSVDIKKSKIGLGFEKLDRDVFDPEKSYGFVAESGVKWARLQSGWQKTEREKGVYDFTWLDSIVDNMLKIGVEPWLCLCYGNELYTPAAGKVFGAVGCPPISTPEEREAWSAYVKATVTHYKGRIHYYEVWNEPDGRWCWKHGPNVDELAEFTKATAAACKQADPACEVIGYALCFNRDFAKGLAQRGVLECVDGVSYHAYTVPEQGWKGMLNCIKELKDERGLTSLKIFQGESGTQSRSDGAGALRGGAWTQLKQAKYLLRHLITDLGEGVELASYFSCMDMIEALNGTKGQVASYLDYGYFGVIGADFDGQGRSSGTYTPKLSYRALQNLCSVFCEDYELCEPPVCGTVLESIRLQGKDFDFSEASKYCFKRENGAVALAYWVPKNVLCETYEGTVSLKIDKTADGMPIRLFDLLEGGIYELSEKMIQRENGETVLKNIPITDSPLVLMIGDFYDEKI